MKHSPSLVLIIFKFYKLIYENNNQTSQQQFNNNQMQEIVNPLQSYIMKLVQITTNDGRIFMGILKGIDDTLNAILISTVERIFSEIEPPKEIDLGVYFIRGDTIMCIGEIDQQLESERDLVGVRGASLKVTYNA